MNEVINNRFAPTPMHGAAYAVAIETVGGLDAIGSCDSEARYANLRGKLDALIYFARDTKDPALLDAYAYGVAKVDADIRSRMQVIQNSRAVKAALETLPRPK